MRSGKRLIGGFSLMMLGFGLLLDTRWEGAGVVTVIVGLGLVLWGAVARR